MVMKIFIYIFILFLAVGLVATAINGARNRAKRSADRRETGSAMPAYQRMIQNYETGGSSLVSESDYLYACYMTETPVGIYDLRKASAFAVTCATKGIAQEDEQSMLRLIDESGIYGDAGADGFDAVEFGRLGSRINDILKERRSSEGR